jgi:hypothetical protein
MSDLVDTTLLGRRYAEIGDSCPLLARGLSVLASKGVSLGRPGLVIRSPSRFLVGPAAVAVLWVSIGTGMTRIGLGFSDPDPLSYLGTDGRSRGLFQAGLLIAAVFLAAFAVLVHESHATPRCFLLAFLIGLGGQVVAAVVPLSGPGSWPTVHTIGGLVLGISLPILMGCFAAGQPAGSWRRLSWAMFWLEAATCVAGVALSQSMRAPIAEAVPAAAFHLWILAVWIHAWRSDRRPE